MVSTVEMWDSQFKKKSQFFPGNVGKEEILFLITVAFAFTSDSAKEPSYVGSHYLLIPIAESKETSTVFFALEGFMKVCFCV